MSEVFPDIPNWKFQVEEVSANVYSVVGTDDRGHRIVKTGTEAEKLLRKCKVDASEMDKP